jgi:membrane protein YdbS with pleckstrin-like domain
MKMAYYQKVLQPDENVKYVGGLHWMVYGNAIALSVIVDVVSSFLIDLVDSKRQLPILLFLLLLSVLPFIPPWFRRATTEIVVTDKRIIHKIGWIARRTEEMNMTKVETVDVRQGVVGRMLGFGTVLIIGIGSSWEPLAFVKSPLELRNAIMVG